MPNIRTLRKPVPVASPRFEPTGLLVAQTGVIMEHELRPMATTNKAMNALTVLFISQTSRVCGLGVELMLFEATLTVVFLHSIRWGTIARSSIVNVSCNTIQ